MNKEALAKMIWARNRTTYWWQRCCEAMPAIANGRLAPPVKFSNRMKRMAGYASSKGYIKLSVHYLMNETAEQFDQTIGHEVVHMFIGLQHKHNRTWKWAMTQVGLRPERCHQYASRPAIRKQSLTEYKCSCGKELKLSKNLIGRIRNGKRYICISCRRPIVLGHTMTVNTTQLRKRLPQWGASNETNAQVAV